MKEKIICVDPGHPSFFGNGSINWGAVSADGTREVEINLLVSQLLRDCLSKMGFEAFLTREDNETVVDNVERITIAKQDQAYLIVRLHCDQDRNNNVTKRGVRTFYPPKKAENIYTKSLGVAKIVHQAVVRETKLPDGGLVDENEANIDPEIGMLVGTREANKYGIPCILVEMVYLSNPQDTDWIKRADNRTQMARGLAKGIEEIFRRRIL